MLECIICQWCACLGLLSASIVLGYAGILTRILAPVVSNTRKAHHHILNLTKARLVYVYMAFQSSVPSTGPVVYLAVPTNYLPLN